jgi:hypothetical protein
MTENMRIQPYQIDVIVDAIENLINAKTGGSGGMVEIAKARLANYLCEYLDADYGDEN